MSVVKLSFVAVHVLYGCSPSGLNSAQEVTQPSSVPDSPTGSTNVVSAMPSPIACNGRKYGSYSYSQAYWRGSDSSLLAFLDSPIGRQWACGDVYVNIADYTNPEQIHNSTLLVKFIQNYRSRVRNSNAIMWLTYGDVVEKNGAKMVEFVQTFFNWVQTIPASVATTMAPIGLSFDVEHIDPASTKSALTLAQSLQSSHASHFGKVYIQHTIEGDPNVVGTDYVMKYADSALAMVYRNYIHDPTGKYQDDSSLVSRLNWMLTQQCVNCLNDKYAEANYKAKITVMVEAACQMGAGCGKISFCAFDGKSQGAFYMDSILTGLTGKTVPGLMKPSQFTRLFNSWTLYSVDNWEWYRCYAPFNSVFTYPSCSAYHNDAAACRSE